jgi:hypothetical protein
MNELVLVLIILPLIFTILGLLIWSLVWVYGDANRRGKPGWAVVLLVLFLDWPISLLVWLVFRPEVKAE